MLIGIILTADEPMKAKERNMETGPPLLHFGATGKMPVLRFPTHGLISWRDLDLFRPALDARGGIMGRTGRSALPHFWLRAVMPVFIVLVLT